MCLWEATCLYTDSSKYKRLNPVFFENIFYLFMDPYDLFSKMYILRYSFKLIIKKNFHFKAERRILRAGRAPHWASPGSQAVSVVTGSAFRIVFLVGLPHGLGLEISFTEYIHHVVISPYGYIYCIYIFTYQDTYMRIHMIYLFSYDIYNKQYVGITQQ